MTVLNLDTPVKNLFMVGPIYARRLEKLGIVTVEDLLHHYPHRFEDYSQVSKIGRIQAGERVTVMGKIFACQNIFTKSGKKIQKAVVVDETGKIEATWFNQPFLVKNFKPGTNVALAGKAKFFNSKLMLVSPEYEVITEKGLVHTGRLVPIYPETYGVSSKWLRSRIRPLVDKLVPYIQDWLPDKIKDENQLLDLEKALTIIHFPQKIDQVEMAKKRLAFDEFFIIQVSSLLRKKLWQKNKATYAFKIDFVKIKEFVDSFPFKLTFAQQREIGEILGDLAKKRPMNRLLEGDVGSGKTVVAAVAIYATYLNGLQSALMAPTEILAQQHFQTLKLFFQPFGVKIGLLTGSQKEQNSKKDSRIDLLIGTHALIYKKANFDKLGLVVIDEQHRFGVEQRGKLVKKGKSPHLLTMTATPIPRTIALTLYGDLDLSILDELPKGRLKIKTWVVPSAKRQAAYLWIAEQIKTHHIQAFVVCPLIEQSEKESMKEIKAAEAEYELLTKKIFPRLRLALLHGRIKSREKEQIINNFRQGKFDILVATPVVEVGIDIPGATIMMIEAADRFGLAQLHQLRGRVGRNDRQSYCLLFAKDQRVSSLRRLKAMERMSIGSQLAEYDLKLRGPGEIFGKEQHGFTKLKIAKWQDFTLIQKAKKAADSVTRNLENFPLLLKKLEKDKIMDIEPN